MLFNLFSPALKLNTGLAILSPGAFEVHSDGIDVDNELFHYPIKKAYTPYNIHTYKTEEVVNQRNIKVKNMTLDEIKNRLAVARKVPNAVLTRQYILQNC